MGAYFWLAARAVRVIGLTNDSNKQSCKYMKQLATKLLTITFLTGSIPGNL